MLLGNGETGVQVRTVLPALQAELTGKNGVVCDVKKAAVLGFTAALKVNITGAEGETPVAPSAGLLLTVTVWAHPAKVLTTSAKLAITAGLYFMI